MLPIFKSKDANQNQQDKENKNYSSSSIERHILNKNQEINMFHNISQNSNEPTGVSSLSTSPESQNNFDFEENFLIQQSHYITENTQLDSSFSDDFDVKGKSKRFFSPNAVKILKKWFIENIQYPYPDDTVCVMLANEAKISTKQVRKWFANKRVRSNKCFKQIYRNKRMPEMNNYLNNAEMAVSGEKFAENVNFTSSPTRTASNDNPIGNIFYQLNEEFNKTTDSVNIKEFSPTKLNKEIINDENDSLANTQEIKNYIISQAFAATFSNPYFLMSYLYLCNQIETNEKNIELIDITKKKNTPYNDQISNSLESSCNTFQLVPQLMMNLNVSESYFDKIVDNNNQPLRLTSKAKINFASIPDLVN